VTAATTVGAAAPDEVVAAVRAADEVAVALLAVDPDDLSPRAAWDLLSALIKKLTPAPND
jgi:hypothetical protein